MCWLLNDGKPAAVAYASRVLEALKDGQAVVPGVWGLEVANVIAKIEAKALVTEARTQAFVATLQQMNIVVDKATASHALGGILHLAKRYKLSSYDAAYLELAMREGLQLATLDDALEKAARKAGIKRFDVR
jgi:predicted nucleic acid-binding protein